jgi:hypothetical protein
MPQHTTISGHTIEYPEPEPKLGALLARLTRMADDAKATEDAMVALVFARDNPLLGPDVLPSRGAVTKETLAKPAWHVMQDLLDRKYVAENRIKLDDLAAEYTLPVIEAAKRLGIHESAVRLAIRSNRLPAWVKEGQYFLSPRSLETYEIQKSGPTPQQRVRPTALQICMGNVKGKSFRVKIPGELADKHRVDEHVVEGSVSRWLRVGVISGGPGRYRFFVLEPAEAEDDLKYGPFYVRGRFNVAKKINNSDAAHDAWKAFEAE